MIYLRRALVGLGLIFVCWMGAQAQRLPGGVRPEHYSLTITPDLAKATFAGSETIEVVLDHATGAITLNAAEIKFVAVKAQVGGFKPTFQTATVTLDAAKQQATFIFAEPLPAGPVTLEIVYTGILNDKLRGFYLSKTKLRSYGVTQFESTDARRAFPSFDEPALKATFDVKLVIDSGDTAISNTKIVSDSPGPTAGKHTVAFAPTPKMSTYLLAWLVGDFECSSGQQDGVKIRVCATPDKAKLTRFAVDAAKWNLHYYDTYFGIKYPLAKLDLVAIPDFEAGAMENFGCITFRETALLVDKKHGGLDAKKDVTTTVAHEMAHQWFGDLVTPQWWDDIWLNEGFATWMESKAATAWKPEWGFAADAALDKEHTLDQDAGRTTRPIRNRADTPGEINEMFDGIAYGKAGAVIGMVEHWVGEETFRRGVATYLADHAYGNATAEDFWNAETRVSGLPVDKVMQSFVDQPGVPQVILSGAAAGVGADAGVAVAQRRFFVTGSSARADDARAWTIPLCFTGAPCQVIAPSKMSLALPASLSGSGFPDANSGDKGYYRTAYSADLLKQVEQSAEVRLSVPERIGLLGDQWASMRAGQSSVGEFLDLALAVKQDTDPQVLDLALGKVGVIAAEIATDDDRIRLHAWLRREFQPVYVALGRGKHENDAHAQLREALFSALGHAQDPAVLAKADTIAKQVFAAKKPSDPALVDAAVELSTAKGDRTLYDSLMKLSHATADPELAEAAFHALTRFQNPELVARTLVYAVSDAVRNQDSWILIASLLGRRETQDQAWTFVEQHWPEIAHKSTPSSGARIVGAAGAFCTAERHDQVASFFAQHPDDSSKRTLQKSLDRIDACIDLRARQEPALGRWLDAKTSVRP